VFRVEPSKRCPSASKIKHLAVWLAKRRAAGYLSGMSKPFTPEQREAAIAKVVEGLCKGTPLAQVCREEGMPNEDTVSKWRKADPEIDRRVAQARDTGFDLLAAEALEIIDAVPERFEGRIDSGHVGWSKARVETRLKLLACWDPKRYGNKTTLQGDKDAPLETKTTVELAKGTAAELAKTMRAVAQAKDEAKDIL
jgi:transposase-like protein